MKKRWGIALTAVVFLAAGTDVPAQQAAYQSQGFAPASTI